MSTYSQAVPVGTDPAQAIRVLHVAGPAAGGILAHVSHLLRGLDRNRYLPAVACPAGHELLEVAGELNLPAYVLPVQGMTSLGAASLALARIARREGYQVLHTHSFTAAMAGCGANVCYPRVPLVCTIHNFLAPEARRRARLERLAVGLIGVRAARIIAISQALADVFPDQSRVQVIYNGVADPDPLPGPEARQALGVPLEAPVVGMVARLAAEKGVLQFVRICARIAQALPEARFVLVGEGPLMSVVEHMVTQLHLWDRFVLPGRIENAGRLLRGMDVLLIPSLWEGASITAVEAMAAGCPVIATRVGGLPEVLDGGKAGMLVNLGDEEGMASLAQYLLGDETRRLALAEAGREQAKKFSLSVMLEQTEAVYSSLFGRWK